MKVKLNFSVFTFLIVVIVVFVSCGDNSLFDQPGSEEFGIDFLLSDGSVIESGQSITFSLILPEDEEKPESLTIIVYTAGGTKIAENTIENPQTGVDLQLELPEFELGLYTITFTLYGKDYILAERTLTFFFAESSYIIKGIESFPPVIYPGATAILKAELSIPEGTDPYLRWTQHEIIIDKGLYSDGLTETNWIAPMNEGVYSIALEIFPVAPLNGIFSFNSPSRMNTEVYVTSISETISGRDLGPAESYYSLFHFNGTYEDTGIGFDSLEAVPVGELELIQLNETLGYRITVSSSITIPELIIPVEENTLMPFTIEIGFLLESLSEDNKILSILSADDTFNIDIIINNELVPEARIYINSQQYFIPSGISEFVEDIQYMLSLTVIPEKSGLRIMWFLDGEAYNTSHIPAAPETVPEKGETIVLLNGIIDELGVYFMNNVHSSNPYIYYNAMKLNYKSNLIFADGFDSTYLLDDFTVSGNAFVNSGVLELKSGQSLYLPEISPAEPEKLHLLNIQFNDSASFTYSYDNSILEISAADSEFLESISSLKLEIDNTSIKLGNAVFSLTDEESIQIKIINSRESSLYIDSLLAYTE